MKYSRYVDVSVSNGTAHSDFIELPPRYGYVEFTFQRINGSDVFDIWAQGADGLLGTSLVSVDSYGQYRQQVDTGPQGEDGTTATITDIDWTNLMSAEAVDDNLHQAQSTASHRLSMGARPNIHNFYRAEVKSTGVITVRFWVTGTRI